MMTPHDSHEALCSEVERKLSAYIDGELAELERLGIERHLESCAGCRWELEHLGEASSFLREEGRRVPASPPWEAVQSTLVASRLQAPTRERWLGFARAIAASIGFLALAGLVYVLAGSEWPKGVERAPAGLEEPRLQLAGLPGLEGFLADHGAEEVKTSELERRVSFSPQVPEELPGGFRLQRAYVVQDICGAGSCLIYRRGNTLVTLVQHSPSHPVSWRSGAFEDCTVAGLACRRARSPEVEVLQIEPEGRNLTLVARAGVIDPAEFVRALSGE